MMWVGCGVQPACVVVCPAQLEQDSRAAERRRVQSERLARLGKMRYHVAAVGCAPNESRLKSQCCDAEIHGLRAIHTAFAMPRGGGARFSRAWRREDH